MVDGVLLLVDASEGPLPADALRAAQGARGPAAGDPRGQQGRPAGRADRRGRRRGLRAVPRPRRDRGPDRVPDRLHERARRLGGARRRATRAPTSSRCSTCWSSTSRRPSYDPDHPLQAHVTNLDASPYVGRLAHLPRAQRHDPRAASRSPGAAPTARVERRKVTELYVTEALDRVEADEAGPGEIIAVAGLAGGHDRRDARRPRGPAPAAGDHRRRAVAVGDDRHQHLAARRPRRRQADRAPGQGPARRRRLIGNVSIRVLETERPDTWEVQGRGELQLAVLVELMRREGFELTVGKPQVVTREIDGKRPRAGRADDDRRARGLRRRRHPAAGAAQGPARADGQPRHRLGADGLPRARARPDRLPHRVPHRDARHRPPAPRLRPLGAVGGRDAHAPDRARWWPTAAARPRASRCSTCRSAARCSSSPARRSTRA